jgi:Asp-tRNA(Asn)/Glu-tRNA(Gln) amidotransferase A subunit family amidase
MLFPLARRQLVDGAKLNQALVRNVRTCRSDAKGDVQAAPPLGWVCADPTENLLFVSKAILVTPAECTNRRADTSVINFLDRCAITVPIRTVGPPLGLMIVGEHGGDRHLLGVGRSIEAALNRTL